MTPPSWQAYLKFLPFLMFCNAVIYVVHGRFDKNRIFYAIVTHERNFYESLRILNTLSLLSSDTPLVVANLLQSNQISNFTKSVKTMLKTKTENIAFYKGTNISGVTIHCDAGGC